MVSQPTMRRIFDKLETLGGFASPSAPASHPATPSLRSASPTPPATVRSRQSRLAPHAKRLSFCLVGLAALVLFVSGCGQGEGGRCQINSDCSSGLTCSEVTGGNGICKSSTAVPSTSDAAPAKDLGVDVPVASGPEVGDVGIDGSATTTVDAESIDTASID